MSSRLLPPNSTQLERAIADTAELERLAPEVIATLWNPYTCPATHLPWLAWALSVDEWNETWAEQIQRDVIAASIQIHRKKGTVGAVKSALLALGYPGELEEWWQTEPKGIPHTFFVDITLDNRVMTLNDLFSMINAVASVKPVRSHFRIRLHQKTESRFKAATLGTPFMVFQGDGEILMPKKKVQSSLKSLGVFSGAMIMKISATVE